jgi:type IV pilus assembly protein PilE
MHTAVSPSRRHSGFTLIELMITVAIVAILTAIAYPSYRNYVLRGKVVAATNGLSSMQANMERYYQDNRQYNTVTPGQAPFSPCDATQYPTITYDTFTVTCAVVNGANGTYTLTATGSGVTSGFVYTVNQAGLQTSTVTSPAPSAWILSCPATWETRAGYC